MFGLFSGPEKQIADAVRQQQQGGLDTMRQAAMKPFNPDDFKGFDSSSLRQALNQQIRRGAADRRAQSLAASQKGGALSSGQMLTGLGSVTAQQAEQENLMNAQLARQDWLDRLGQYKDQQNMLLGMFGNEQNKFDQGWGQYDQKRQEEANFLPNLFGEAVGVGKKVALKKLGV